MFVIFVIVIVIVIVTVAVVTAVSVVMPCCVVGHVVICGVIVAVGVVYIVNSGGVRCRYTISSDVDTLAVCFDICCLVCYANCLCC